MSLFILSLFFDIQSNVEQFFLRHPVRNPGVFGFSCRILFIFESSQLIEFLTDLQDPGL